MPGNLAAGAVANGSVVLAHSGDPTPGSPFAAPCYRIPALAVTATGRVLAAWDVRSDWRDLPGDFDLVLRHSDDHGRSWSEPRFLRAHTRGHGFGDASLIALDSGRVLCWYAGSRGESFFSARAGGPGLELWLASSDDDGLTWTHRQSPGLRPRDVGGMFAASGNGIQLRSGRILQPFVLRRPTGRGPALHAHDAAEHWAALGISDDGGCTWRLGERIGPDCDEGKVVETATGVLVHARARGRRRWALSVDGGERFGTPVPHPDLVDPACNGGLCRWGGVLVSSLLDDESERRRLVLRLSADQGLRWSAPIVADTGAAGYSVVAPLADGNLGLLYEAGDYSELVFRRVTPDQTGLVTGRPTLVPREGSGAATPPEVSPA